MAVSSAYAFLLDTYDTERLKTLGVWAHFEDADLTVRLEPRARTPLEQMVHQCVSEDTWMRSMLDVTTSLPALPPRETRLDFLTHYAAASAERLAILRARDDAWWTGETRFFDVSRPRTWVMLRRLTHSAHHRGQLTMLLRARGASLYSTYGPTADTGGLFQDGAPVIYRYGSVERLLEGERAGGGPRPALPGSARPTERPGA